MHRLISESQGLVQIKGKGRMEVFDVDMKRENSHGLRRSMSMKITSSIHRGVDPRPSQERDTGGRGDELEEKVRQQEKFKQWCVK